MNRPGIAAAAILLLILGSGGLTAQQQEFQLTEKVDWAKGALLLDITAPIEGEALQPDSRFDTERDLERALPALFMESVVRVVFDSYRTVGDRIKEEQEIFKDLNETALSSVRKLNSRLNKELQTVQVQYRFPFYGPGGLIEPLIAHERPYPVPGIIGFVPSRNFTGLVIYAKGELPAHGKDIRQALQPALFPKLYDEDMKLILSVEMCDPEYLRQWGMAAYAYSEDESTFLERVRTAPLRTVARGVFGIHSTDIILADDAARKLLVREANKTILGQGRILIIIDKPED